MKLALRGPKWKRPSGNSGTMAAEAVPYIDSMLTSPSDMEQLEVSWGERVEGSTKVVQESYLWDGETLMKKDVVMEAMSDEEAIEVAVDNGMRVPSPVPEEGSIADSTKSTATPKEVQVAPGGGGVSVISSPTSNSASPSHDTREEETTERVEEKEGRREVAISNPSTTTLPRSSYLQYLEESNRSLGKPPRAPRKKSSASSASSRPSMMGKTTNVMKKSVKGLFTRKAKGSAKGRNVMSAPKEQVSSSSKPTLEKVEHNEKEEIAAAVAASTTTTTMTTPIVVEDTKEESDPGTDESVVEPEEIKDMAGAAMNDEEVPIVETKIQPEEAVVDASSERSVASMVSVASRKSNKSVASKMSQRSAVSKKSQKSSKSVKSSKSTTSIASSKKIDVLPASIAFVEKAPAEAATINEKPVVDDDDEVSKELKPTASEAASAAKDDNSVAASKASSKSVSSKKIVETEESKPDVTEEQGSDPPSPVKEVEEPVPATKEAEDDEKSSISIKTPASLSEEKVDEVRETAAVLAAVAGNSDKSLADEITPAVTESSTPEPPAMISTEATTPKETPLSTEAEKKEACPEDKETAPEVERAEEEPKMEEEPLASSLETEIMDEETTEASPAVEPKAEPTESAAATTPELVPDEEKEENENVDKPEVEEEKKEEEGQAPLFRGSVEIVATTMDDASKDAVAVPETELDTSIFDGFLDCISLGLCSGGASKKSTTVIPEELMPPPPEEEETGGDAPQETKTAAEP